MLENHSSGCILNIASILGMQPSLGQSAYSASKTEVIQLARIMALELDPRGIVSMRSVLAIPRQT